MIENVDAMLMGLHMVLRDTVFKDSPFYDEFAAHCLELGERLGWREGSAYPKGS